MMWRGDGDAKVGCIETHHGDGGSGAVLGCHPGSGRNQMERRRPPGKVVAMVGWSGVR